MFSRARTFPDPARHACASMHCVRVLVLVCGVQAGSAQADAGAVYQIDDVPGEIHLSDRSDAGAGVDVRRIVAGDVVRPATRAGRSHPFAEFVRSAAATQRLPPALIEAVIAVESAWHVRAVSSRGASGLMQLMPATAKDYGVTDIFDPAQNIAAGARHLRQLLDRYGQDMPRALAAYNAGAAAIDRADLHRGWPNAETAAYVPGVLARYAAHEPPPSPPARAGAGLRDSQRDAPPSAHTP